MPNLYLMCGLPGSGKTTLAKKSAEQHKLKYISPDELYANINGDETIRDNKFIVWHYLFYKVHKALSNNEDVIIDTQSLRYEDRQQFIDWFPDCDHHLITINSDFGLCLDNMAGRKRKISEKDLEELFDKFEYPDDWETDKWETFIEIYNIDNTLVLRKIKIGGRFTIE